MAGSAWLEMDARFTQPSRPEKDQQRRCHQGCYTRLWHCRPLRIGEIEASARHDDRIHRPIERAILYYGWTQRACVVECREIAAVITEA
jgi:hypothetical protein